MYKFSELITEAMDLQTADILKKSGVNLDHDNVI